MKKMSKMSLLLLIVLILTSCKPDYVEPIEATTTARSKNEDGLVSKEVVTKPTINLDEILKESEDKSLNNEEVIENKTANAEESIAEESIKDDVAVSILDMKVDNDDRVFHGVPSIDTNEYWKYGMTPCEWVYIEPGIQIVSNYKPNTSAHYSINSKVSSGLKGCFVPIFTKTDTIGSNYDGRVYIFEDYSKEVPDNMLFSNKLSSVKYRGVSVEEILVNNMNIEKLSNGVLKAGNDYINVIYATDLDKFLE